MSVSCLVFCGVTLRGFRALRFVSLIDLGCVGVYVYCEPNPNLCCELKNLGSLRICLQNNKEWLIVTMNTIGRGATSSVVNEVPLKEVVTEAVIAAKREVGAVRTGLTGKTT